MPATDRVTASPPAPTTTETATSTTARHIASAPGPGVYGTRYGVFTVNTVNGDAPRILGTMPGPIHLDMNLTRAFKLNPKNTDHPRILTFNARSANLLNHSKRHRCRNRGLLAQRYAADLRRSGPPHRTRCTLLFLSKSVCRSA